MRLTDIHANRHIFDDRPDDRPIRLLLSFDEGPSLRVGVGGDGESALIDHQPLDPPFDMAEYGRVDIADVTDMIGSHLRCIEVTSLGALVLDGREVGVRVELDTTEMLNIWVDCDELYWGNAEAFGAHDWRNGAVPALGSPMEF